MAVAPEDIAWAKELFADLGDLTTRRMMGGLCLYCRGTIFAILHGDHGLMLKGAGEMIPRLEAMGCDRWVYTRKDGASAAMPYWTLPPEAQDDPEAACDLAREALRYL